MPEHHVHLTVNCSECGDDGLVLKPSTKMQDGVYAITSEELESQLQDAEWGWAEDSGEHRMVLFCPECWDRVCDAFEEE